MTWPLGLGRTGAEIKGCPMQPRPYVVDPMISAKAIAEKADLTDLVTSVTNAELTLQTVVAVRDRMISAYQDIIKMPI